MNFQKTSLVVASVFLLTFLVGIGFLMYRSYKTKTWPPMISECPDYWKVTKPEVCENVKQLGNCSGTVDFSGGEWQGKSGLKKKYEWARHCNITWDGITNNPSLQ
jgi:hypothetical protein